MPEINASTKKYGTPISARPIAVVTPMMKPSNSCPPSHALTLLVTSALSSDDFCAPLAREQPDEEVEDALRLDQQVKRQQQDGDEAEHAADETPHACSITTVTASLPPGACCSRSLNDVSGEIRPHRPAAAAIDRAIRQILPESAATAATSGGTTAMADAGDGADDGAVDQRESPTGRGSRAACRPARRRSIMRTSGERPVANSTQT